MSALDELTIGFIGGGNMARAIVNPLLTKNIIKADKIIVSAKTEGTLQNWKIQYNVQTREHNYDVIQNSDIIFVAVKPQVINEVLREALRSTNNIQDKLFISIAAGVTLDQLQAIMQVSNAKLIRLMPNMAVNVCKGIAIYCSNKNVTEKDKVLVHKMFTHLGIIEEIDERIMDVAGGLIGCGPAFAYTITEALSDGAVLHGLPRELATQFAAQVLIGAGQMILETRKHPGELKDQVCSPGGTTIEGIYQLERGGIRGILMNAIDAVVNKSKKFASK